MPTKYYVKMLISGVTAVVYGMRHSFREIQWAAYHRNSTDSSKINCTASPFIPLKIDSIRIDYEK
jgi:hypothetical protein